MTLSDVPASPSGKAQRVGLEEVALEAGVSVATASRALSGGAVRAALRQRVETAALRLGYRPDLAAQAVARGTTKTVALIVDYLRSPFGVEITRGVVDAAARHGLVVNVTGAETHPGDLLEMIASVRALRPRSLVLATGRVQDPLIRVELIRALDSYQASGGSVAIIDGLDLPFASCAFDEVTAARALCDALVKMGYQRPVVFNSSAERTDLAGRTDALLEGFRLAGLMRESVRLTEVPTSISRELPDDQLLDLGDADVVVCVEGAVIPGVYRLIRGRGLRVGIDVAVTAFGQYGIAHALRPHLTTVELPLRRAGELAMEHSLSDRHGAHLSLPGNLRIRASSPRRSGDFLTPERRAPTVPKPIRSVAVIIPSNAERGVGAVAQAVFAIARENGRQCAIVTEQSFLANSADPDLTHHHDAVIVCGRFSRALAEQVRSGGLACVVLDAPSDAPVAQLSIETWEGMQRLLEHLYALGHTRIAYLAGPHEDPEEQQRRWGVELFTSTHADASVRSPQNAGDESVEPLEGLLLDGATAVIAHDDVEGARVVQHLTRSGYDVPGSVSVAGFGGTWASELSTPALTTVRLDVAAIAGAAWRLLDRAIDGEVRSLSTALIVRSSTAAVRQT